MSVDWTRDEIILACDLVQRNGWKGMNPSHQDIRELSRLLKASPLHPVQDRDDKFRNPNGVARKTWDIATQHPDYPKKRTKGNRLDREVLEDFRMDPQGMRAAAREIRIAIERQEVPTLFWLEPEGDDEEGAVEGRLLLARHRRRERDPGLRRKKIEAHQKNGQATVCEVCSFDFGTTYGSRGKDYIEVHHVLPLHVSGETRTKLGDLAMLCANCHRMIHRGRQWLTPAELKDLIERIRAGLPEAAMEESTGPQLV
ncbi:HNH endonuclease [Arthrobacter sp. USHLN218]|uniref:HNH endonuclease n=1 Tax=Arthrobacter sp. USHLN218 TaxID=3081232 RepID=UPI0030178ED1